MNLHSVPMTPSNWLSNVTGWQKASSGARKTLVFLFVLVVLSYGFAASDWKISHNSTHSISYKFILTHMHHIPGRDQLIIFTNSNQPLTQYSRNTRWIKFLRGLPGDTIEVVDRKVYVNGQFIAEANVKKPDGSFYEPLQLKGPIPPHKYLAMGTAPDSFDSRYEAFGLVDESEILGTGYPIY